MTSNPAPSIPPAANRLVRFALCLLLLAGGVLLTRPATAENQAGTETHAGMVIQFGDGTLREYCIDLGADGEATGEEALRATGADVVVDYQAMGAAICKIESDGCNFPAQDCFCECTMLPGEPCTYWAYHRLEGNQWVQSPMGSSSTSVTGGSVEGWSWGTGSVSEGTAPPIRTFDQLCAAIIATETPTPSPTLQPTSTATVTPRPSATATVPPTPTPAPTGTLLPTVTTAGLPSTTPLPSATGAALPTNTPLPTATQVVPTNTPPPGVTSTNAPTSPTPTTTAPPASVTETVAPPSPLVTSTPMATSTPMPTLAAPVITAPTPTLAGIAVVPTAAAIATPLPPLVATENVGLGSVWLYGLFGAIVVGLVAVIGWLAYRQRVN